MNAMCVGASLMTSTWKIITVCGRIQSLDLHIIRIQWSRDNVVSLAEHGWGR